MKTIDDLKVLIEKTRKELDALIITEEVEKYLEKSRELDKLIEEYLDLEKEQYVLEIQ